MKVSENKKEEDFEIGSHNEPFIEKTKLKVIDCYNFINF